MQSTWIQTFTGMRFDLADPRPEMVDIRDIAHALSRICRFNGHVESFYSVAEHSVHAATEVSSDLQREALLHDAAEAYLFDCVTPLKALLPGFRVIENRVWGAIAARFQLDPVMSPAVKQVDLALLRAERDALLKPTSEPWAIDGMELPPLRRTVIEGWSPDDAERRFLDVWDALERRSQGTKVPTKAAVLG